jgi:hypothetical protein
MDAQEKTTTRKNTKISFRTDDLTLAKLKAVCRVENKTVSSLIEDVLTEHVLCQENPLMPSGEKRQSPRKQCSIPAVILSKQLDTTRYCNATIVNLSSSAMQIILKRAYMSNFYENGFDILFSLPGHDYPILLSCQFIRSSHIHEESMIVSKFTCTEVFEKNMLMQFLLSHSMVIEHTNKKKKR